VGTRDSLSTVWVVKDGTATRRVVTLGPRIGSEVEVLSGLRPGETIAISDVMGLSDGQPVIEAKP